MILMIILNLLINDVKADDISLRLSSRIVSTDSAIVQFPAGGASGVNGKMIDLVYDWEPHQNFYLEGAMGYRSWNNIFNFSSVATEISPGFRVTAGYFVFKLSEGVAYMPNNAAESFNRLDFVTHISFGLKDPKTGIGIYLDRSHYSNGNDSNNPSLDYAGFQLSFPIGRVK